MSAQHLKALSLAAILAIVSMLIAAMIAIYDPASRELAKDLGMGGLGLAGMIVGGLLGHMRADSRRAGDPDPEEPAPAATLPPKEPPT